MALTTSKLLNVRPPQVTTVAVVIDASKPVLTVQGMLDALAILNESSEKAKTTKNLFIAFPPNRILSTLKQRARPIRAEPDTIRNNLKHTVVV